MLLLEPDLLWQEETLFWPTNAASVSVYKGEKAGRAGLDALKSLYAPVPGNYAERQRRYRSCPTDIQAEALVPDFIDGSKIKGVVFKSEPCYQAEREYLDRLGLLISCEVSICLDFFNRTSLNKLIGAGKFPEMVKIKSDSTAISLRSKAAGAMSALAAGDALGWPNERATQMNKPGHKEIARGQFVSWAFRSGSHYNPRDEMIAPGEYSDDTQLTLCVGRSLLYGSDWWEWYTKIELPFWYAYERGGGAASKLAVRAWSSRRRPWATGNSTNEKRLAEIKNYFEAGGNGVAMRILPHILLNHDKPYAEIRKNIILDGICTHGHPRALIGATAYGYALWYALNKQDTLGYGELVHVLIEQKSEWAAFVRAEEYADKSEIIGSWLTQADVRQSDFERIWDETGSEMEDYLEICKKDLALGMLSQREKTLQQLSYTDEEVNGSGTISAAISVYLASQCAVRPENALPQVASLIGADTDTLASMTGALLGCIHGKDWVGRLANRTQDIAYIDGMAASLVEKKLTTATNLPQQGISSNTLKKWRESLALKKEGDEADLPDHRRGRVSGLRGDAAAVEMNEKSVVRIEIEDEHSPSGQSIYVRKVIPNKKNTKTLELSVEDAQISSGSEEGKSDESGNNHLTTAASTPRYSSQKTALVFEGRTAVYDEMADLVEFGGYDLTTQPDNRKLTIIDNELDGAAYTGPSPTPSRTRKGMASGRHRRRYRSR